MTVPTRHTHEQRDEIVERLIEMHESELGSNLHGLATQGSFARGEDGPYSDLEIVVFLNAMPSNAQWVDREQVYDGMLVDIVWTTKDEYIARVKEVTPDWYTAGSDRLGPTRVNRELIDEINAFTPQDLHGRCLVQAEKRWPALFEATTKVLNAAARKHPPDLARLVLAMLDHVLVELAFLNTHAYKSSSTFLQEALTLPHKPGHLGELVAIATDGAYTDHTHVNKAVMAVFTEMRHLLEAQGASLAVSERLQLPALPAERPGFGFKQTWRRLWHSQSALAIRDVMSLAMPTQREDELASIYEWHAARTTSAIRTSYAAVTAAVAALLVFIHKGTVQAWTIAVFALVVAFALVLCALQQAELAQLPRERAVAMHLLTIFEKLANAEHPLLEPPVDQPENSQNSSTRRRVTFLTIGIVLLIGVLLFVVALWRHQSQMAIALAFLVPVVLAFARRILAEIRPSPTLASCEKELVEQIGGVRLDDYISDRKIAASVNERIKCAMNKHRAGSGGVHPLV